MVRINLLPPEIIEKRRYDRYMPFVFVLAALGVIAVLAVWAGTQVMWTQKTELLQQTMETTQGLTEQANALKVFDQRESQVKTRETIAAEAVAGRVPMGRVLEEVSLVLPDPVWVERLKLNEVDGLTLSGVAPDSDDKSMADGYKLVAATAVRINLLDSLKDVWVQRAESDPTYAPFRSASRQSLEATIPVIEFELTSGLSQPSIAGVN